MVATPSSHPATDDKKVGVLLHPLLFKKGEKEVKNIYSIAVNIPLMTCPSPIVNWKGEPRVLEESNTVPSVNVPALMMNDDD